MLQLFFVSICVVLWIAFMDIVATVGHRVVQPTASHCDWLIATGALSGQPTALQTAGLATDPRLTHVPSINKPPSPSLDLPFVRRRVTQTKGYKTPLYCKRQQF